jgi:hypothetical protein
MMLLALLTIQRDKQPLTLLRFNQRKTV